MSRYPKLYGFIFLVAAILLIYMSWRVYKTRSIHHELIRRDIPFNYATFGFNPGKWAIWADGQPIYDLNAFAGLPIEDLFLSDTPLTNISAVTQLPYLRYLEIEKSELREIGNLFAAELRTLGLRSTAVSCLSGLAGMTNLIALDVSDTNVSDLNSLSSLPLLTLRVSNTRVYDIGPLAGLPLLYFDGDGTQISNVNALAGMPLLEVNLAGTPVGCIEPLEGLPIRRLNISGTMVSDLRSLQHMQSLDHLDISSTKVTDLTPLYQRSLKYLSFDENNIPDLTIFNHIRIKEIVMSSNAMLDARIEPLRKNKRIRRINGMRASKFWQHWEQSRGNKGGCVELEGVGVSPQKQETE